MKIQVLIILFLGILLAPASVTAFWWGEGIITYWDFEEGSGAIMGSNRGVNLTSQGSGFVWDQSGFSSGIWGVKTPTSGVWSINSSDTQDPNLAFNGTNSNFTVAMNFRYETAQSLSDYLVHQGKCISPSAGESAWGIRVDAGGGLRFISYNTTDYEFETLNSTFSPVTGTNYSLVVRRVGRNISTWINQEYSGCLDSPISYGYEGINLGSDGIWVGYGEEGAGGCSLKEYAEGLVVENLWIIKDKVLTDQQVQNLGQCNNLSCSINAAIFVTDLNVSDFQLASSTYVSIHNDTINVSITRKFGLFNFMVANKMGGGASNLLTMRVLIDGVSACEKDLATLDTANEYEDIAGCLVDFVLTPGGHSLTFQAKRSGSGTIDITNYKAILYEHQSNANSNISDTSVTTGNLTTFNTSFNPILNINVNKTSSSRTFHYVKITVESNDTETVDFYLNDTLSGEVSPFVSIYIAGNTAKGSVFIPWASNNDETSHILKLYARSRGGQLINVSNITVHNIDLKDALGNVINATEITNATTNLSRGRLIGASTTETLLQRTIKEVNGTSLWIAWSATINSSQKTSPSVETFIIGQPQSTCFGRVRQTLGTGGTNGNIFDMIVCSNLTPGNSYLVTFNVTTESGKPIRILDEMVTIVEGVMLNISEQNLAPLPNTIIAPANGSTVTQPINVTWRNFTDPDGDAVTYNVTLWNSSGFLGTISDNLNDNLTLFDITGYPDSTYILKVEGCDPLLLCSHSNSSFTIDTSPLAPPLAPMLGLIANIKAQAATILTEVSQFIVLALYLILAAMAGLLLSLFANMMLKGGKK